MKYVTPLCKLLNLCTLYHILSIFFVQIVDGAVSQHKTTNTRNLFFAFDENNEMSHEMYLINGLLPHLLYVILVKFVSYLFFMFRCLTCSTRGTWLTHDNTYVNFKLDVTKLDDALRAKRHHTPNISMMWVYNFIMLYTGIISHCYFSFKLKDVMI